MSSRPFRPPASHKTLTELVYKRLRDNIMHGRLNPEELISTGKVAKAMRISSMPVRAALTRLETEGLVSIVPQKGVKVSKISIEELEELFLIRSRLEGLAAYLASPNLTESDLQRLRGLLHQMSEHARNQNAKRWLAVNEQWHQLVFRATRNEQLTRLLMDLWHRGMPRRIGAPNVRGHMERRFVEHQAILSAFEKRDSELAERLWRDHILTGGEEIIKFLRNAQT